MLLVQGTLRNVARRRGTSNSRSIFTSQLLRTFDTNQRIPFHLQPQCRSHNHMLRLFCTDKMPTVAGPSTGVQGSFADVPGVKSEGEKYALMYTCGVCDTRAAKMVSKQAYHHGTVLIRCPKCENLHLIADHLGQFEEKGWTAEDFLAERGGQVRRVDDVLELTLADITGVGRKE